MKVSVVIEAILDHMVLMVIMISLGLMAGMAVTALKGLTA